MGGRILLDTNIVIAIFAGDAAVLEQLQTAQEVFLPSIVLGELYYGALNSTRSAQNIARLEAFRAASAVVGCNAETSVYYGDVKFALKQNGTPIPENDIWIAALACQHELILVSRDGHFNFVKTLETTVW